jgi:hypothetical protein
VNLGEHLAHFFVFRVTDDFSLGDGQRFPVILGGLAGVAKIGVEGIALDVADLEISLRQLQLQ